MRRIILQRHWKCFIDVDETFHHTTQEGGHDDLRQIFGQNILYASAALVPVTMSNTSDIPDLLGRKK